MSDAEEQQPSKKFRWEDEADTSANVVPTTTRWSSATPRQYSNETPRMGGGGGGGPESSWRGVATPSATPYGSDGAVQTPQFGVSAGGATPMMNMQTPGQGGATPTYRGFGGATPMMGATPAMGATPNYQFEGSTPVQSSFAEAQSTTLTAAIETQAKKLEREWRQKNKRLTAEYLDEILPGGEYFEIVPVPAEYNPPAPEEPNFYELATKSMDTFALMQSQAERDEKGQPVRYDIPESLGKDMPPMKTEDAAVFVELLKFYNVDPVPDEYLPSYLLMRNLFKIKNGDNLQRRNGTRFLLDKVSVFGSGTIVQRIAHIWNGSPLSVHEKHYFVEFIKLLITTMGRESRDCVSELVHMMMHLFRSNDPLATQDGKQVLTLLARVVGFQPIYDAVKGELTHDESTQRRIGSIVIAVAGYATGSEELLAALEDMSQSRHAYARQSAARSIGELADLMGHSVVGVLVEVVPILERFMQDDRRVRRDVARAVSRIAENSVPYGIDELKPLVDPICEECKRGIGSTAAPFLHAFGTLVQLMSPYDAQEHTAAMMPTLVTQFSTPEDEYRRVMLIVVRKCVMAAGVSATFIRDVMLDPFMKGFWGVRRVAADRKTAVILVTTTTIIAKKLGGIDVLARIVPDMKDEEEHYQHMVLEAVRKVVIVAGLEAAPDSLVIALLDGAIAAVRQDESGLNRTASDAFITICNTLGARMKPYLKQVFDLINRRREHRLPQQRMQAAHILASIAPAVALADGAIFLQEAGRSVYERMEDDDAGATAANLRATLSVLEQLGSQRYRPSVGELLKRLTFVVKNRFSSVQHNCMQLIEYIATNFEDDVDAIHLYELATKGLFELLGSDRRATRQSCTRTFGVIAQTIRPFAIILELVDNFRQDKRKIRICTAVALGAIAKACGPFTVIPYLLNEFRISEGEQVAVLIQHSVLKAIRYIFEAIGTTGKEYVYPLIPLLERALTETSMQMRRMATEACTAIVQSLAGQDGFEAVATHFLNFVHPNIVELLSKREAQVGEERLKLVTAVVSYYQAARLVLGPGKVLQYLEQGLFHPARKVRDIYRRTYNMVYILSPESMVPYYPKIEDDPTHTYTRHELEVLI